MSQSSKQSRSPGSANGICISGVLGMAEVSILAIIVLIQGITQHTTREIITNAIKATVLNLVNFTGDGIIESGSVPGVIYQHAGF